MKSILKVTGISLLFLGIYFICSNSNYVSSEEVSKHQYFCENHSQVEGVLNDSVDVLKFNQNKSHSYKYVYTVAEKEYNVVVPSKSKSIGETPMLKTTIYYQENNPEIASASNPCSTVERMRLRQNKKILYYLGFVLVVVGIIFNRIK